MKTRQFFFVCLASMLCAMASCNSENKSGETGLPIHVSDSAAAADFGDRAKVYNLVIIDESGSMWHLQEAVKNGVNQTFATIKKAGEDYDTSQIHFLSVVTFNMQHKFMDSIVGPSVCINELFPMSLINGIPDSINYHPNGGTPLYDAIGISVNKLYNTIKDDENSVAVVTILSDGYENASREYTCDSIRKLVLDLTEKGWSFSYMGSAHDVKRAASAIGIKNTLMFDHTDVGTRGAYDSENVARNKYYNKLNRDWAKEKHMSRKEKEVKKRQRAEEYYDSNAQ